MSFKTGISLFFTIVVLIAAGRLFAQDTTLLVKDSTFKQSGSPAAEAGSDFKSKVIYNAHDSIRFDVANQKMYLFGEGTVTYESMVLKADYIEFDMSNKIAFSRGRRDSVGNVLLDSLGMPMGDPVFTDAGKSFDAKELTYNFQTKKGKIRNVTTKEGNAYIHARDAKKDTGDVYYMKNARYTTCELDNPHFYLQASKIKVIPKDKIIVGPSYLVVGDVPTPLVLPFGVFPNKKGRKSGVIIPAYGESEALGFSLENGGYYFGFNDYFDVTFVGNVYSKGSYKLYPQTRYVKRYKYTGSLALQYDQVQFSEKEFPDYHKDKSIRLIWHHDQDPKFNPTSRFSASVDAGGRSTHKYLSNNANDYLSNTFSSNIGWYKSMQGGLYNLSVNIAQRQTTIPTVDKKGVETIDDLTAPEILFTRERFFPFLGKNHVGSQTIFQKIGISPKLQIKNTITANNTILFTEEALKKLQNGLLLSVPVSTSINIGPVIITPSASGNGYGYLQSYRKHFNVKTKKVDTDTLNGFKYAYDYNTALSFSTKLYGMYTFKNSKLKGVRHVMTPSASVNYRPDFSEPHYGVYETVQDSMGVIHSYSIFENSILGRPAAGRSGVIMLALDNSLEMKLRPAKKDTSGQDRKIVLIESFGINSFYNMAIDTFQWSNVNLYARTRLFKVLDINLTGTIDPYAYSTSLHRRIDRFQYNLNGQLGRWIYTSADFNLGTNLSSIVKKTNEKTNTPVKRMPDPQDKMAYIQSHPDYYVDFDMPWDLRVDYKLGYSNSYVLKHSIPVMKDTIIQSLGFSGNLSVTPKWKVGFRSGFDFLRQDFTYTSFDIYRDLHCWEMRLHWIPFGLRKSYMLTISVKASELQDLKLDKKRNWYDNN